MYQIATLAFIAVFSSMSFSASLHVSFKDLPSKKGEIKYLLFKDPKGFPDQPEKSVKGGALDLASSEAELTFEGLEPGEYALSVFHDENKNEKLDTNFLGMPKESFGFSSNPRIYFGPPDFDDAAITVGDGTAVEVKLKKIL